jgi:hypothetical protein
MDEKTHPNIFPTLRYEDASAASGWLGRTRLRLRGEGGHRGEDGRIHHAELRLGAGPVMLGQHRNGDGLLGLRSALFDPGYLRRGR